ncbi:glycosyl hydrolase [Aspergillus undulatus]|uniref:glycosyl hydrolase n=1 Tax=Aspergillus undulatus TaxID=1810928 RepID=UPI003CCDF2A2
MFLLKTAIAILALAAHMTAKWIVPGARWVDTDGNLFNAHAGGLCVDRDSGKFFCFGEYKVEGHVGGGISVYSSDDLATWQSHGLALEPIQGHKYISNHDRVQRSKAIYSEETGQYYMWWHADDDSYSWLLQGLATADNIAGPYTFVEATSPLGNCVEGRDVYVSKFNGNLTAVEEVTYWFPKYDFEAPTILQTEKSYYALMSHKTGYRPNSMAPWSQPFFVSPAYSRTFSTQSGFLWRIDGSKKTMYLYMADQLNQWDMNSLWESRNIWLPIEIDDEEGGLKVLWQDDYNINVKTGEWKPIGGQTYISKHATLAGDAYLQEAIFASGNRIATGIHGNDNTITFTVEGQGTEQWVSFCHQSKKGQRDRINGTWQLRPISSVVVNGDRENVHTLYQKDTHDGIILSTPLRLPLEKGLNTITAGGLYNGFDHKGADLDRIVVYPPEGKRKRSFFEKLKVW